MSRKSAEALAITSVFVPDLRPDPPEDLNAAEAREWKKIVRSMPGEWFTEEMWPLLSALCVNIALLKKISKAIRDVEVGTKQFMTLSKLQLQYSEQIGRLSTKLKLTPQSRHNHIAARKATKDATALRRRTPWEDGGARAT